MSGRLVKFTITVELETETDTHYPGSRWVARAFIGKGVTAERPGVTPGEAVRNLTYAMDNYPENFMGAVTKEEARLLAPIFGCVKCKQSA